MEQEKNQEKKKYPEFPVLVEIPWKWGQINRIEKRIPNETRIHG